MMPALIFLLSERKEYKKNLIKGGKKWRKIKGFF
jgi:hypothetical protein